LTLVDVKEGWDMVSKVKASNAKLFLSLDLPEEKKEEKKDDKKSDDKKEVVERKEEKPKSAAEQEKEILEKRRTEFISKYVGQASTYQKAGLKFGFSSISAKSKDIPANLRRMIAAGLPEDAALASLTTTPAEIFGLSDRLGTIDNGKIANLVISDKPYFSEKAKVRYVFVEGILYKQEVTEEKKGDKDAKIEIEGSWSVTTEIPQGKSQSKLTIKKDGTTYSAKVSGGQLPQTIDASSVELESNILKVAYMVTINGQTMDVKMEVTVDGKSFKGNTTVTNFGSFPVEGKKVPKF